MFFDPAGPPESLKNSIVFPEAIIYYKAMVKVVVSALAIDPNSETPVIILREETGERTLSIWIGTTEATAIANVNSFTENKISRPLTHDLLKMVIDGLGASLVKIIIDDLINTTYKAKLYLQRGNEVVYIDARPSDAIALALRMNSPVFVANALLGEEKGEINQAEELRKKLRAIDPTDFGKFSLE
jgi:bifunctional DNase/RNase